MPLPIPVFTPWFPWSHIDGDAPADIAAKLRQVGCYLLARFDGAPPAGAADPANAEVFYIGETHGNSTSLWGRLSGFGNSAGFYAGQWSAHYAAWGYPAHYQQDDIGPGQDGAGRSCSSARVFVALCPWPGGLPAHFRGIFPTAIEQQAIWLHTEANGQIPRLNNSGRVYVPAARPMPELPDDELDAALARSASPAAAEAAVKSLAQRLAVGMDYSATRRTGFAQHGHWRGAERVLGRECLYIGWNDADPGSVTFSVYHGEVCLHDGGAARTRDELRAMLETFWSAWHA